MRALIAALVLSAAVMGASQTRVWLKTTSRPGSDTYTDVVTDPLGNVFVCGNTIDSVSTKISMLAVKYDKNGVKIWEKVLPGASGHSFSTAIALDPNGHVVVVGQTEWAPPAEGKARMVKLSAGAGAIMFENVTPAISQWYDVVVDRLGEVSATGYVGNPKAMRTGHYLSNGTLAWNRDYIYPGLMNSSDQAGKYIHVDTDQNIYVCGVNNDYPNNTYNTVVKYSRTSSQLWMNHKSFGFRDYPRGFVKLSGNRTVMVTESKLIFNPNLQTGVVEYDTNGVEVFTASLSMGNNSIKGLAGDPLGGGFGLAATGLAQTESVPRLAIYSPAHQLTTFGFSTGSEARSIAAGFNGDFYLGTNEVGSGPRRAFVQLFHVGAQMFTTGVGWKATVFGSTANGQVPFALPQAMTCDLKGDLIVILNASGAQGQDGFIAKYETYPDCQNDTFDVTAGMTFNSDRSVLANDMQTSQGTLALAQGPLNGTLTLNSDGTFTYVPGPSFTTDSFTYRVTRTNGATVQSDTATVTLN